VLTLPEQRRNGTISAKFLFFDESSRLRDGKTFGRKSADTRVNLSPANFSGYALIGAQTDNIQRNVLLSYDIALRSH
jgi:hypothetical protein